MSAPQRKKRKVLQALATPVGVPEAAGTGAATRTSEQLMYQAEPAGVHVAGAAHARAAVADIVAALLPPNAADVKQVYDQKLGGQVLSLASGFSVPSARRDNDNWLDAAESRQRDEQRLAADDRKRQIRIRKNKLQRSRQSCAPAFGGRLQLRWEQLQPLHQLWSQYAQALLGAMEPRSPDNPPGEQLLERVARMDYHGALISVSASKVPSLVGLEGIVVLETKSTFKLVLRDDTVRTVAKSACSFRLQANGKAYTLHGPNIAVNPVARASRKVAGFLRMQL